MIPTKRNNTDCEVSREEISFWLSHLASDKVIIALSEHNAILPLSGITQERKEQPEAENTCDSFLCLLYKVQV